MISIDVEEIAQRYNDYIVISDERLKSIVTSIRDEDLWASQEEMAGDFEHLGTAIDAGSRLAEDIEAVMRELTEALGVVDSVRQNYDMALSRMREMVDEQFE